MFAADNESDRDRWVNSLKASAGRYNDSVSGESWETVSNPVVGEDVSERDWRMAFGIGNLGTLGGDVSGRRQRRGPDVLKEGYLEKKSSTLLRVKEWHKRFFKLDKTKKALLYWEHRDIGGGVSGSKNNGTGGAKTSSSLSNVAPGHLVLTEATAKPKSSALAKLVATLDDENDKGAGKDNNKVNEKEKEKNSDREVEEDDGGTGGRGERNESSLHGIPEKGGIPIADIRGHLSREDTTGFNFTVRSGRVYHLRAESAEDRDEWIDAIEMWVDYFQ